MIDAKNRIRITKAEFERLEGWLYSLPVGAWNNVVIEEGESNGIGSTVVAYATDSSSGQGWFKEISDTNEW